MITLVSPSRLRSSSQHDTALGLDAWAQHPYPVPARMKPSQKVKWPNVVVGVPKFEASLDTWFKRKNVRVDRDAGKRSRTEQQLNGSTPTSTYAAQALALAKKIPRTDMFIWFVFRDHKTSEWQSGLRTTAGAAKPSLSPPFGSATWWRRATTGDLKGNITNRAGSPSTCSTKQDDDPIQARDLRQAWC